MGSGLDGDVYALLVSGGLLVAGGSSTARGRTPASTSRSGTAGVGGRGGGGLNGDVHALATYRGRWSPAAGSPMPAASPRHALPPGMETLEPSGIRAVVSGRNALRVPGSPLRRQLRGHPGLGRDHVGVIEGGPAAVSDRIVEAGGRLVVTGRFDWIGDVYAHGSPDGTGPRGARSIRVSDLATAMRSSSITVSSSPGGTSKSRPVAVAQHRPVGWSGLASRGWPCLVERFRAGVLNGRHIAWPSYGSSGDRRAYNSGSNRRTHGAPSCRPSSASRRSSAR